MTIKKKYTKEGITFSGTPYELKENCGDMKSILVSEAEIKTLVEKSNLKYPNRVLELLKQPNSAIIKVIKAGWSINDNYYDSKSLKELVSIIDKQGSLQFANHLEEGSNLDRKLQELVSYSKDVWYDTESDAIYAAVKFPKEKQDTQWIFNLIKEDPEVVGVSISACVYIQEDFEKDGKKGDKIEGWAIFESADYVLYPSAGGGGVEASKVIEKIKKAKESVTPKLKLKFKKSSEQIVTEEVLEKVEFISESMKSFMAQYKQNQAFGTISHVTSALSNFMWDCMYAYHDEKITTDDKMTAIETAFKQASDIIMSLDYLKNPEAEYDKDGKIILAKKETILNNKPNNKGTKTMKLSEFKTQNPEAYVELQQEMALQVKEQLEKDSKEKVTTLETDLASVKTKVTTLESEKATLTTELDSYKVAEKAAAKRKSIEIQIEEAKIPKEFVSDVFANDLMATEDEAKVKEKIADRKSVIEGKATPKTGVKVEEGRKTTETLKSDDVMKQLILED